jgi:hypothetical protein
MKTVDNPVYNTQGYYVRLSRLNEELEDVANQLLEYSKPLMQA